MSIRKRKLKDGTTVYDATLEYGRIDGKRDRETRTFRTLKEAREAEREAERLKGAMRHRTGAITLGEYVDRYYWPIASKRLEATTLDTYRTELDKRILPHLGDRRLQDIDRLGVQRMVDSSGTESVARKSLGLLKTVLNEAMGDGFIDANPALARYAMPRKGRKRDNGLILTDFDQIGSFIGYVQDTAPETIVKLVMTGLMLGLRPEERYALDYEDFDFADGTVEIRSAYVYASKERGGCQMKRTKTELSHRLIPMPQPFIDWFYWTEDGTGPWIRGKRGARISPTVARHQWKRYLEGNPELPKVTLENMRHSFATSCLHAGMNVEDLSRMLGHSDINTTFRRYVKPDIKNIREGLKCIPYPED